MTPHLALDDSIKIFQEERNSFYDALTAFWKNVSQTTLLVAFLDWIKEQRSYDLVVENSKILIENGLMHFSNAKKEPLKLGHLVLANLSQQIEAIRCQRNLPVFQREQLVETVLSFFRWLSIQTASYIPELEDPDKQRTKERSMPHDVFMKLLELLDERCCIIAKLLYFGGGRTLD